MLTVLSPALTNDLTVLDTLKSDLGITDTAEDIALMGIIRQASDMVTSHTGRKTFGRQTVRQTEFNIYNKIAIMLDLDINVEISSVIDDGVPLSSGVDYMHDDAGLLYRYAGIGAVGCDLWYSQKVEITYSAGYTPLADVPHDLERAVLDLCAYIYHKRPRDPTLRSERILDVIETRWGPPAHGPGSGGLPIDIADRLKSYRRSGWGIA